MQTNRTSRIAVALLLWALPASAERPSVRIVPGAPLLVLGDDTRLPLEVHAPAPVARWLSSLGKVENASLTVSERRAPGFALVAAEVSRPFATPLRGATIIPLVGRGALATHTSQGAAVTVEIAGRSFGPVTADKQGDAAVPVEVPPGIAKATVVSVDRYGLRTVIEMPLPTASFPLALVLGPTRLEVGAKGVVTVFAIDGRGHWRGRGEQPTLSVDHSLLRIVSAKPVGKGRWDFVVLALAPADTAHLGVALDGREASFATVTLVARPPSLSPPEPPPTTDLDALVKSSFGVRVGGVSALGALVSLTAATDVAWPLRKTPRPIFLAFELGTARGTGATYVGREAQVTLTQAHAAVSARIRIRLRGKLALNLGAGAGYAFAHARIVDESVPVRTEVAWAPLAQVSADLAVRLGTGAVLLDLRFTYVEYGDHTRVAGNALGLGVTTGYRF